MESRDIIQRVIDLTGATSYLEIGVKNGDTFLNVRCRHKIGVDPVFKLPFDVGKTTLVRQEGGETCEYHPVTSDEFFGSEPFPWRKRGQETFDVAFIDGLHTMDQVIHDMHHCIKLLRPGGVIVIHDCNPTKPSMALAGASFEEVQKNMPPSWDGAWCGDVWKAAVYARAFWDDVRLSTLDVFPGHGILIKTTPDNKLDISREAFASLNYQDLEANRKSLLDLRPASDLDALVGMALRSKEATK